MHFHTGFYFFNFIFYASYKNKNLNFKKRIVYLLLLSDRKHLSVANVHKNMIKSGKRPTLFHTTTCICPVVVQCCGIKTARFKEKLNDVSFCRALLTIWASCRSKIAHRRLWKSSGKLIQAACQCIQAADDLFDCFVSDRWQMWQLLVSSWLYNSYLCDGIFFMP